jgi:hypothetical protein
MYGVGFKGNLQLSFPASPHVSTPPTIEIVRNCDVHSCRAAKMLKRLKFLGGELWPLQTAEIF